ncbi:MAG: PEP-CTERM sorting domain-containing protein [Candidatus Omnitrophica bacterium]|nr:PEP-CTERM sorting domain-containing protein [Candidatus Omnitrophota bacterium]MBU1997719.1 PEP-CTERM sorting domain-containing protein [Candidatus Omnitrophota bacterium]MBU4334779.1 PEP-CTERM sorting domain-containing protein [Candidatus Omnitrophota bacterium]
MKRIALLTFVLILGSITSAHAVYTADGILSDWGIDLSVPESADLGYLETNTPKGVNADYETEDISAYGTANEWYFVGPGWSNPGNTYDVEGLYFDNDAEFAYIAIVTGLHFNIDGGIADGFFDVGDIFLDTGLYQNTTDTKKYAFGIDVSSYVASLVPGTAGTADFYGVNDWQGTQIFSDANPWTIGINNTGAATSIDFAYSGNQNTHYVMEAKIPLSLLGLSNEEHDIWAHWTMQCGNDVLNLKASVNHVVPEPATMLLFGTGLAGAFLKRKKRTI